MRQKNNQEQTHRAERLQSKEHSNGWMSKKYPTRSPRWKECGIQNTLEKNVQFQSTYVSWVSRERPRCRRKIRFPRHSSKEQSEQQRVGSEFGEVRRWVCSSYHSLLWALDSCQNNPSIQYLLYIVFISFGTSN